MKPRWWEFVLNLAKPYIYKSYGQQNLKMVSFTDLEDNDNKYTGWFYILGCKTQKIYEVKLESNKVVFLRETK